MRTNEASLYVSTLITMAWNLRMHAKNAPEHEALIVKGAGTTLMRQIYELARVQNKPRIELTALNNSLGFYRQLQMTEHVGQRIFNFPVHQDWMPEALDVPSGNLLT